MRIASIEISNILGTRTAAFKPGTLTTISGANGQGKTSIIQGLLQCFVGGHDPSLLRRGAKLGQVVITLDNGSVIKYRVTASSTTYEVLDEQGNQVRSPRSFIEELGQSLTVDPTRLLTAKPKDLVAVLLEIMPLTFSKAELETAIDENTWPIARDLTLDEAEELRRQIYEARTTANRQAKEAEATAKSLRASLPKQDDVDWAQRTKELRELVQEARQTRDAALQEIERRERELIEEIKAKAQREIDQVRFKAKEERASKDAEFEPDLAKINVALGEAEQQMRDRDRAAGIRVSLENFEKIAKQAVVEASHFSAALEGLDELKQRKLAALPIRGLEVREGQVYADGVPFERVNLAERIKIAFQIAALRSGHLPFMVLDQAESLDPETWEAFKAGAKESGFQIVAARVSSGPLAIEVAA